MVLRFLKKLFGNKDEEEKAPARENPFAEYAKPAHAAKKHHTQTQAHATTEVERTLTLERGATGDIDDEHPVSFPEKLTEEPEAEELGLEPVLEAPTKKGMRPTDAETLRVMEAALFMSSKGLSVEELGNTSGVPLLKARELIPELVDGFNMRNKALEIVEDLGGFRMKVRAPYDEKVNHLAGGSELSSGEMKTLAFIAYKQPLIQSQLVQVRSNTAYEHLHNLVEKGFVSKEPKGRTFLLRTTKKFSEYFGAHALKLRPMTIEEKLDSRSRNMQQTPEENEGDQSASEDLV